MRVAVALGALAVLLAGCEVRTLYGVEVVDVPEEDNWNAVRMDEYTLYLSGTQDSERPGLYLMAQAHNQADPPWDWEDYQDWPEADQVARFDEYYDLKFRDVSVASISRCAFEIEHFDHRDSAREMAYGRWLQDMGKAPIDDAIKGALVRIPVAECEKLPDGSGAREAELTVVVGEQDEIPITIRVEFVDAWFD